jgi:hypothetical protein
VTENWQHGGEDMRDLTKSMMSFSWAISMFSMRQMAGMLSPQTMRSAAEAFDAVARCTREQLDPTTQSMFQTGDRLQRGIVDFFFGIVDRANPGARSAAVAAGSPGETGWGPMPGGS